MIHTIIKEFLACLKIYFAGDNYENLKRYKTGRNRNFGKIP